ncbi:hypoxia-inducible factor 1-alpha-like isoform X2 [Ylistrum balloti]|uniref:hypoxia-inducible factor 1-alpha-like isoform X2 n=1 Tax=Ylistrum balloti TaxID=509963 RepID=UPI002905A3D0|nr:hypoxia-inducible factor 1-alpha-like isoform X2 [Ylistrum balloti]
MVQQELAGVVKETCNGKRAVTMDLDDTCPVPDKTMVPVNGANGKHVPNIASVTSECVNESNLMLAALNGFLMVLDRKKNIIFVSDNVEGFLGISQTKMIGNSAKDFLHPNDIPELKKQFNLQVSTEDGDTQPIIEGESMPRLEDKRLCYLRMRYNTSKPGLRSRHSGYTLVQWSGRIKMKKSVTRPHGHAIECLVCICRPMQSTSITEIRLDGSMFMSRHDLGMRFTFCDTRIVTLIGYEPCEVLGRTAYQFHNPLDAQTVGKCHSNLIVKGTSVSKYYRFLGKNCEWVWMQTRATIIYNTKNVPQYIVCMNYIISEEEGQRYIMMDEEKTGKQPVCAPGVIDLSETPTCEEKGDHSDSGYISSNSPYSSTNPSPADGHRSDDNNGTLTEADSDFPPGVFQEVANTINPSQESIFEMINSFDKETGQLCDKRSDQSPLSEAGGWMDPQGDMAAMCPPSADTNVYIPATSNQMISPPSQPTREFQRLLSSNGDNTSLTSSLLQTQIYTPQGNFSSVGTGLHGNCDILPSQPGKSFSSSLSSVSSASGLIPMEAASSSRSPSVCSGLVSSPTMPSDTDITMLSPIPTTSAPQLHDLQTAPATSSPQRNLLDLQPVTSPAQRNLISLQSIPASCSPNSILNLQSISTSSPQQNLLNLQPLSVPSSSPLINLQPVTSPQNILNARTIPSSGVETPQSILNLQTDSPQSLVNTLHQNVPPSSTHPQNLLNVHPVTSAQLLDLQSSNAVTSVTSPVSPQNQPVSPNCSQDMMNLQLGITGDSNGSDITGSGVGDSLPPEISDLWLQFCSTMTDNQVQQVLDEFRREELLSSIEERRNRQQATVGPVQATPNMGCMPNSYTNQNVNYQGCQKFPTVGPTFAQGCDRCVAVQNGSEHFPSATVQSPYSVPMSHTQANRLIPNSAISCASCSTSQNGHYLCVRHKNNSPYSHTQVNSDGKSTTMSELEKMLRGYSSTTQQQCVGTYCESQSINSYDLDIGGSTLLKQMLTGHLSGECYHAMEKRRQATTNVSNQ